MNTHRTLITLSLLGVFALGSQAQTDNISRRGSKQKQQQEQQRKQQQQQQQQQPKKEQTPLPPPKITTQQIDVETVGTTFLEEIQTEEAAPAVPTPDDVHCTFAVTSDSTCTLISADKELLEKYVSIPPVVSIDGREYTVTAIGDGAFKNTDIRDIFIPDGITTIGSNAFSWCPHLRRAILPKTLTTIGKAAFSNCYSLTSIYIPEGVTTIGEEAFNGCMELEHVTLPSSLKAIENYTFHMCGLTSINIPDGVAYIGPSAFEKCSSLPALTIPESVRTIGKSAFYYCKKLKGHITYPKHLKANSKQWFKAPSLF